MSLPTLDDVLSPAPRAPVVSPDHRVAALVAPVLEELLELVEIMEREGGTYARRYMRWLLMDGGHGGAPHAPEGLHQMVVRAIRELCADELYRQRRQVTL